MSLKVKIQENTKEVVGKGTIDGVVPFYFKDQGHRWMVRIGQNWTFKQRDLVAGAGPSVSGARNKMYWAIAQFRNQSRDLAGT
ncbi:hypothetical protein M8756_04745 [Lutimaribacter sp. EGI FJ00015]|uniref:Uncharacterized protein n=1 Tax=Lutimaribacter degradans TaxID=2945989 RepID=A0ACC5ZTN0_9RHOB|nr:hypothetical protein [Lutimaribacter sp. EGI FJ00013]MCM2561682.1 hypothetical protein [Lutimaribacter sp. EGI FJ00013]MCO0612605.1 hypothetical protein [Lutimaribacter sp. EGI FJ00015]MCO0635264.1 hypothetical protein [Lutimaribacter sp. EGI FJ00014]